MWCVSTQQQRQHGAADSARGSATGSLVKRLKSPSQRQADQAKVGSSTPWTEGITLSPAPPQCPTCSHSSVEAKVPTSEKQRGEQRSRALGSAHRGRGLAGAGVWLAGGLTSHGLQLRSRIFQSGWQTGLWVKVSEVTDPSHYPDLIMTHYMSELDATPRPIIHTITVWQHKF